MKYFNRPWLHFLILGFCLFQFNEWLWPPNKPVVGPLSEKRIENLSSQWQASSGRPPSTKELQSIVGLELDQEILFQEGLKLQLYRYDPVIQQRLIRNMQFLRLAENKSDEELLKEALNMELHLADEAVRRRTIQMVKQMLLNQAGLSGITEHEIRAEYEANKGNFKRARRYSIEHIYIAQDRESEIVDILSQVRNAQMSFDQAAKFSSPFLLGYRFTSQTPNQLARHFGNEFVTNLEALKPEAGTWTGPIRSAYGFHLVWVNQIEEKRDATLAEVHQEIERELSLKRRNQAMNQAITQLRQYYEVVL